MTTASYQERRSRIATYFDRTAVDAWARLTSDAPVGRIRATVRAGRDEMRGTLLDWLPRDLRGRRLLDAGCGTGALAAEAARRGAQVVGIDLSHNLVDLARTRCAGEGDGELEFRTGDMLDPDLGRFDHVVAMDSLIHYPAPELVQMLGVLAASTETSLLFTFAPRTPALGVMHALGRVFPRSDRAPAIEPIPQAELQRALASDGALQEWRPGRDARIHRGFYISHAMELRRA